MKKGMFIVFLGLIFSTFYIEIDGIRLLPALLSLLMIAIGTQKCTNIMKAEGITSPALGCSYLMMFFCFLEDMISLSRYQGYAWILTLFQLLIFLYYLYAFLASIQMYDRLQNGEFYKKSEQWLKGIVILMTFSICTYCIQLFLSSTTIFAMMFLLGFCAKIMAIIILFRWYRKSFTKGTQ